METAHKTSNWLWEQLYIVYVYIYIYIYILYILCTFIIVNDMLM